MFSIWGELDGKWRGRRLICREVEEAARRSRDPSRRAASS
jgi:hypothetical protein